MLIRTRRITLDPSIRFTRYHLCNLINFFYYIKIKQNYYINITYITLLTHKIQFETYHLYDNLLIDRMETFHTRFFFLSFFNPFSLIYSTYLFSWPFPDSPFLPTPFLDVCIILLVLYSLFPSLTGINMEETNRPLSTTHLRSLSLSLLLCASFLRLWRH